MSLLGSFSTWEFRRGRGSEPACILTSWLAELLLSEHCFVWYFMQLVQILLQWQLSLQLDNPAWKKHFVFSYFKTLPPVRRNCWVQVWLKLMESGRCLTTLGVLPQGLHFSSFIPPHKNYFITRSEFDLTFLQLVSRVRSATVKSTNLQDPCQGQIFHTSKKSLCLPGDVQQRVLKW